MATYISSHDLPAIRQIVHNLYTFKFVVRHVANNNFQN